MTRTRQKQISRLARRLECLAHGHKPVVIKSSWATLIERMRLEGEDVTVLIPLEKTVCSNCGVKLP